MPDKKREIEIRSDEVQEIMSQVPNWMIRWGISLFFGLICLSIFVTWFIKYPDVINGTVTLTTSEPPIKLVTKNSGEVNRIYFQDKDKVSKGDVIVTFNNVLSNEAKVYLESLIKEVRGGLERETLGSFQFKNSSFVFGMVQSDYNSLIRTIADYQYLINESNTTFKISNLIKQVHNHTQLRTVISKQFESAKSQLIKAKEKFNSDQLLYQKEVISKMQFYEEEKKYNLVKNNVDDIEKLLIQNTITLTDLEKQLNEIEFNYRKEKTELLSGIDNYISVIENAIDNWKVNYQITSPIDGTLVYLDNISQNQFVASSQELFAIVPDNEEYVGYIKIPKTGYGKIEKGQNVRIKLDNYPFYEYGQVNGSVSEISLIPNEETYLVQVQLTDGLMSSYNKELVFTPEMSGSAEIITEDLRLMERIFNKFRKIFDN